MKKRILYPEKRAWKRENAFETYLLMGPNRSLAQLARDTGYNAVTLGVWSRQFKWQDRIQEQESKAIKTMQGETEKLYIEGVKKGHQKIYQELQDKAMKLIRKKNRVSKYDTVKDLTIAADVAIKGERTTLGLNDTKLKMGVAKEGFMAMVEMLSNNDSGS